LNATSQDRAGDLYEFRSSMSSALCLNWWVSGDVPAERIPDNFPFAWAKTTLEQYLGCRQFFYGDYYPLTAYSQNADVWIGYQLDRPDLQQGMVLLLRRPGSPYESARFPLRGLDARAQYQFADVDTQERSVLTGRQLMEQGLAVNIAQRPGSALFLYEAVQR
jgi:alpha-galactosidase